MPIFTPANVAFSNDGLIERMLHNFAGTQKLSSRRLFDLTLKRLDDRNQYGEISRAEFLK